MRSRNAANLDGPIVVAIAAIAGLGIGCGGRARPAAADAGDAGDAGAAADATDVADVADPLASVPCQAWQPSSGDWSSLPGSRPTSIGPLTASASGRYLYSVGTWLDAGSLRGRILRSHDLGQTWCALPTPE